jgi:putative salt-induced outer membrane protein
LTLNTASIYSSDASLNATTANSLQGIIRYDRDLNKRLFVYGAFAGGYDELQDLDYRLMPGSGLSFHAIATDITTLLTGVGYTRESYNTGLTRNLVSATIGDELTHKLSSRTTFTQNLHYLPSLNDTSVYRLVTNVGLTTKLVSWVTANLLFNGRYNSQPVLGNKKNDVIFTTGLRICIRRKKRM